METQPGLFVWTQRGSRTLQDAAENDKTAQRMMAVILPDGSNYLFPGIIAQEAALLQLHLQLVVSVEPAR